jgi:hypothetical protein
MARALSTAFGHVWTAVCIALALFLLGTVGVLILNALHIVGLVADALLTAMGI